MRTGGAEIAGVYAHHHLAHLQGWGASGCKASKQSEAGSFQLTVWPSILQGTVVDDGY